MATAWEYTTITYRVAASNQVAKDKLAQLGLQGWELVNVVVDERNDHIAFLKRLKP